MRVLVTHNIVTSWANPGVRRKTSTGAELREPPQEASASVSAGFLTSPTPQKSIFAGGIGGLRNLEETQKASVFRKVCEVFLTALHKFKRSAVLRKAQASAASASSLTLKREKMKNEIRGLPKGRSLLRRTSKRKTLQCHSRSQVR